jgi:hypothetical protein
MSNSDKIKLHSNPYKKYNKILKQYLKVNLIFQVIHRLYYYN